MGKVYSVLLLVLILVSACRSRNHGSSHGPKSLNFADREWWIKSSPEIQGPGNNLFHHRNSWVDWAGHLHLQVAKRKGQWTCAEVFSKDHMGYGRYEITVDGEFGDIDPNLVFGFFTWNPDNFESQANSEIDIEFSKWGYPLAPRVLHYSVHPVSLEKLHLERFRSGNVRPEFWNGRSRHVIEWRDTSVTFSSYLDIVPDGPVSTYHYSFNNPARVKGKEGERSAPITVPQPGENNQVRFNFWIFGEADAPLSQKGSEVIIRDFKYEAF